MKNSQVRYLSVIFIFLVIYSCNNTPKRDLYPNELVGGFELLSSEQTGIDFQNNKLFFQYGSAKQSETVCEKLQQHSDVHCIGHTIVHFCYEPC